MLPEPAWHWKALLISSRTREWLRKTSKPKTVRMRPEKVVRLLAQSNVDFMAIGSYGVTGWLDEPQATQDMDVLVNGNHHSKAIAVIAAAFPRLQLVNHKLGTRFVDPTNDKVLIDLFRPATPLLQAALEQRLQVCDDYYVPNLEMAVVTKFAVFASPGRTVSHRFLDAAEIMNIVDNYAASLDMDKVKSLWRLEAADNRILRFIQDIPSGLAIQIQNYL